MDLEMRRTWYGGGFTKLSESYSIILFTTKEKGHRSNIFLITKKYYKKGSMTHEQQKVYRKASEFERTKSY